MSNPHSDARRQPLLIASHKSIYSPPKIRPQALTYGGRTPSPIVTRRAATPAESRRIVQALRAALRGWTIQEVDRRLKAINDGRVD